MIDLLVTPLDYLSWRWLLQIVLLSFGLTLACYWGFRGDSLSRRSLGVAAVWLLVLVPLALLVWQPRYQIGLANPPQLPALAGLPPVLLLIWAITACAGCVALVRSVLREKHRLNRLPELGAICETETPVWAMSEAYSQRLQIVPPSIARGEQCSATSIGRKLIVVPEEFGAWPETAQRSVIAHELVHLQRCDDRFMVALQLLARCYPFCPWLHLLYQRFVVAVEEACDERAAELIGSRALYLEGLAEAALRDGGGEYVRSSRNTYETCDTYDSKERSVQQTRRPPFAALINAQHRSSFIRRLHRLLEKQKFFEVQSGALAAGTGIGLAVLAACTTFEFVDLPDRYRMTVMSVEPRVAARTSKLVPDVEHEVRVISKLPEHMKSRDERLTPAVIYPGRALLENIEGDVLIEFGIAADGTTVQPSVVRSTHPKYLNRAAIRAVERTVYRTDYDNYKKTGFSGVAVAQRLAGTGELLAVRSRRSDKAQKLFLFRLNAADKR